MSSKNRRAARKITMLVRMDRQMRAYWMGMHMPKRERLIAAMKALGSRLANMGLKERAWAAVEAERAATPYVAKGIRRNRSTA